MTHWYCISLSDLITTCTLTSPIFGTFMRNGYQPETKQQEDAYLKNSNNIDPKKVKCSTGKFMWNGLGDFYEKWLST